MNIRLRNEGLLSQNRSIKREENNKQTENQNNQHTTNNVIKIIKNDDLLEIIKPERLKILNYIRKNKEVLLTDLIEFSGRSRMSINNDIKILLKAKLIKTDEVKNPAHGVRKIISATSVEKVTIQTQI